MKLTRSAWLTDGAALAAYLGVRRTRGHWLSPRSLTVLFAICACPALAWNAGYSNGYEPYPKARLAPAVRCSAAEVGVGEVKATCRPRLVARIVFQQEGATVSIGASSTRVLGASYLWAPEVLALDINADSISDMIFIFPSSANGLGNEDCLVTFALSDGNSYKFTTMQTMGFGAEDLLDLDSDGRFQVVHTDVIRGPAGRDGREHNYWVYHLFRAAGASLELLEERAPVWIMFTFRRPNHTATDQLTDGQKARAWESQHRGFYVLASGVEQAHEADGASP